MIKNALLYCFLVAFSLQLNSQELAVEIVLQNSDTLKGKMEVVTNTFDKKMLYADSFTRKVKFIDGNNTKRKISAKEIKKLWFNDFHETPRVFVFHDNELQELIYEGILKCYIAHYPGNHASFDIYDETGKRVKTGPFTTSDYTIKKAVKFKPELVELLEKYNNEPLHVKVPIILSKYEETYLKAKQNP
ncbi:MAG TPA: hypothetical protein VF581_02700 [Flavobacterium sp.]|jgi:hypothetical protein